VNKYLAYALGAAAIAVVSILTYQHLTDPAKDAENGRLKGQLATKTHELALAHGETIAANVRLDSALNNTDTAITRWRTRILHDTIPALPVTATPHDTIAAVTTELATTKTAGDSVVRACTELANSCQVFRQKATAEISAWSARYATLDSLYRAPRPAKRLNLSLSVGFGYATPLDALAPKRQVFVGVTFGRSVLSW
jgi:hypothetical protein